MIYTFKTENDYEAKVMMNALTLEGEVEAFLEFLRRYDKHIGLTPEADKVLEDIRTVANHLRG